MLGCIVPVSFALLLVLSAYAARGADLNLRTLHPQSVRQSIEAMKIGASPLPKNLGAACTKLLKEMKLCR